MGLGACGAGPSLFFGLGWGSLYKHRRITLGIEMVCVVNMPVINAGVSVWDKTVHSNETG